jgi:hypothetical protein
MALEPLKRLKAPNRYGLLQNNDNRMTDNDMKKNVRQSRFCQRTVRHIFLKVCRRLNTNLFFKKACLLPPHGLMCKKLTLFFNL